MEKEVFWIRETEKGLMGRIQKANIKNMCKVKIFEKWQKTNRSVAKMKKEKQFTFSIMFKIGNTSYHPHSLNTSGSRRQASYAKFGVDLCIILCHSASPFLPSRSCNRWSKSFSVTISCSLPPRYCWSSEQIISHEKRFIQWHL